MYLCCIRLNCANRPKNSLAFSFDSRRKAECSRGRGKGIGLYRKAPGAKHQSFCHDRDKTCIFFLKQQHTKGGESGIQNHQYKDFRRHLGRHLLAQYFWLCAATSCTHSMYRFTGSKLDPVTSLHKKYMQLCFRPTIS